MNPPKSEDLLQDEEYQLTFLLDEPLNKGLWSPTSASAPTPIAEHVLHLGKQVEEGEDTRRNPAFTPVRSRKKPTE